MRGVGGGLAPGERPYFDRPPPLVMFGACHQLEYRLSAAQAVGVDFGALTD